MSVVCVFLLHIWKLTLFSFEVPLILILGSKSHDSYFFLCAGNVQYLQKRMVLFTAMSVQNHSACNPRSVELTEYMHVSFFIQAALNFFQVVVCVGSASMDPLMQA